MDSLGQRRGLILKPVLYPWASLLDSEALGYPLAVNALCEGAQRYSLCVFVFRVSRRKDSQEDFEDIILDFSGYPLPMLALGYSKPLEEDGVFCQSGGKAGVLGLQFSYPVIQGLNLDRQLAEVGNAELLGYDRYHRFYDGGHVSQS